MSGPNVELLEQVMQHIEDHPAQHNQLNWVAPTDCGTAMCFAGWAAALHFGDALDVDEVHGSFHCPAPYDRMPMSAAAQAILGLTKDEGDVLFTAWNSTGALRLMVKDLVNGESLRDPEYYDEAAR